MTFPKNVAEPHETKAYRDDVLCKQFDVTRSQLPEFLYFLLQNSIKKLDLYIFVPI